MGAGASTTTTATAAAATPASIVAELRSLADAIEKTPVAEHTEGSGGSRSPAASSGSSKASAR